MSEQSREMRIDKIIAEYLAAVEKGQVPDCSELLARYADLAQELQAFLQDREQFGKFAAGLPPVAAGSPPSAVGEQTVAHIEKAAPEAETVTVASDHGRAASLRPTTTIRYFGDYELLDEIARGGMGVVYKARQVKLNRIVAVKMILAGQLASDADVKRFYTEAEAAANLQHPNIVAIHEVGEHAGQHYFSMDFVEGKSLAAIVRERPLLPKDAARYVRIIAEAIQHAHDKGILHRDLKPSNVLIDTTDQPRVTDFGLAKRHETEAGATPLADAPGAQTIAADHKNDSRDLTEAGQIVGTAGYMPPEQARGERVGPWADVYSIGAILYELLAGKAPFTATNMFDTLEKVLNAEPVTPRRYQPSVPRDLETICLKCLQKEPAARYASAKALAEDLRRFDAGEPIVARPVGRLERTVKWSRRHPARATAAMLVVLMVAMVGVGSVIASLWVEAEGAREQAQTAYEAEQTAKRALEKTNQALNVSLFAEQKARGEADEAKEQVARFLYLDRVALAWKEFQAGRVSRAQELLAKCEEKYRHFEWHHLNSSFQCELATLAGHKGPVVQTCYSSDAKLLASVGADKTVKLWNTATGREMASWVAQEKGDSNLCLSPDGGCLAYASRDGSVRIRDVANDKELVILKGDATSVVAICFSPDGQRLASVSKDQAIKIWDTSTGKELAILAGEKKQLRAAQRVVSHVSFSPDGRRLAAASQETVKLWDVLTGNLLATMSGHKYEVNHFHFSPDGQRLATGSYDLMAKLWDTADGKELAALAGHKDSVVQMCFSPNGQKLASASWDHTVKLWDAVTGKNFATLAGHKNRILFVCFSPDGQRLASASDDKTVKIWDTAAGRELATLSGHKASVLWLSFSPDGQRLVSASADSTLKIWDMFLDKAIATITGDKDTVVQLSLSPDGQVLASANDDAMSASKGIPSKANTVKLWDAKTGKELATLAGHTYSVGQICFSPDSRRLASASLDGNVKLWNVATATEFATLPGKSFVRPHVNFSSDGKKLAIASWDTLRLVDQATGKVLDTLKGHKDQIKRVSFSPDGRRLASASYDKTVKLWEVATGKELTTLLGHTAYVSEVSFSPDGKRLASASWDNTVKLWDTMTGRELATFPGFSGTESHVYFSPDGKRLALPSIANTVKLWDVDTGKELATFAGHDSVVVYISFSPDGQRLTTASKDSTIKLWDVATGKDLVTLAKHKYSASHVIFSPDGQRLASSSYDGTIKIFYATIDPTTLEKRKALRQDQQATDALQARRWFAAAFHLRQLLKLRPDDAEIQRQLQHAEVELKKEQEARKK